MEKETEIGVEAAAGNDVEADLSVANTKTVNLVSDEVQGKVMTLLEVENVVNLFLSKELSEGEFAKYLQEFPDSQDTIANILIERDLNIFIFSGHIYLFKILSKKTAMKLIESGEAEVVLENLERFEGLDNEIAMKLIERRQAEIVLNNVERFKGLVLDRVVAMKLIESGKAEIVLNNVEKFDGLVLDRVVAMKIIESGKAEIVLNNVEKFDGLVLDREIAMKLIERRQAEIVLNNVEKFDGLVLDSEIAMKIIESGEARVVVENLKKFEGLDREIAMKLIESGEAVIILYNVEKFEELDREIAMTLIESGEFEAVVENIEKFTVEVQKEFWEAVRNYEGLNMNENKLKEFRNSKWYKAVLAYVYAKGNYSNYKDNLAMGDKTVHLNRFVFKNEGYLFKVSGLLGYKLDEGTEEDIEKFKKYEGRLNKIRNFITSRGPNNEALKEEFTKKVERLFAEIVLDKFKQIEGLNLVGKIICIILSELLSNPKNPSEEIRDLLVEYKYAYFENLEDYIQRSAVDVQRYTDQVSQRRSLWNELSNIYGENQKHILQNELFKEFQSSDKYDEIMEVVREQENMTVEVKIKEKDKARFKNVFENQHIEQSRKFLVFKKQALDIARNNLRFDSNDEEEEFNGEFDSILNEAENNFNYDYIVEIIVPALKRLNLRFRLKLNNRLRDMFSLDINDILGEVAKYKEVTEVEAMETRMNGPKNKKVEKSIKEREVKGFFVKTQESANARMGAYLCFAGDKEQWNNPNYFECVLEDQETKKCIGVINFLHIEANDGKKYLWFGPNPNESFLCKVSSKLLYDQLYKIAVEFAKTNGYDGVVIPSDEGSILGSCTNRGGDFPDLIKASRLKDKKGDVKIVEYGKSHVLGLSYSYSNGALIWEK